MSNHHAFDINHPIRIKKKIAFICILYIFNQNIYILITCARNNKITREQMQDAKNAINNNLLPELQNARRARHTSLKKSCSVSKYRLSMNLEYIRNKFTSSPRFIDLHEPISLYLINLI